jgi:hypothetical protein
VPRSTSSFPPSKSRDQRNIKLRNAFIKTRVTIRTSQKISEESHSSTQLQQNDLIMGNILTKLVQQTLQQLYLPEPLLPNEVTYEIKLLSKDVITKCETELLSKDVITKCETELLSKDVIPKCEIELLSKDLIPKCEIELPSKDLIPNCEIELLPKDVIPKCEIELLPKELIQKLADLLSHDDALNLNQTCKLFRERVPHICLPPSTEVIKVGDLQSLENGKLVLSEVIMLGRIPLEHSTWIDLIQHCCPNLKYLFIIYECRRACFNLDLDRILCVEISMKIKMLNMDRLSIHLPSTVENFTAHISMIDSKAFKKTSSKYMGGIGLRAETLENLKSL